MTSKLLGVLSMIAEVAMVILAVATGAAYSQQTEKFRIDIQSLFTPSGWMGDGEYNRNYIDFTGADRTNPHSSPDSIRIAYTFGPKGWGGIYWQNRHDNWGEKTGNDYSGKGFSNVTFWARGELGGEVVEFKVGGIDNPSKKYRDSLEVTIGRVILTNEWKQYRVDLAEADLGSVIGGFCWVASRDYNTDNNITFYLDDIVLE